MSLESLRRRIDGVDRRLLSLFNQRAEIVRAIARFKRGAGLPVYDPGREAEVVRRLRGLNRGPLAETDVAKLFADLIADFREFEAKAVAPAFPGRKAWDGGFTVSVVGMGLIGGSIALRLRQVTSHRVIGFLPRGQTVAKAMRGMADEWTRDPRRACAADLVVFAAPVSVIVKLLGTWARFARPGSVWTDVGSVKAPICEAAKVLPRGVAFVGGHPMAGSEKSGMENARADLFEGAWYGLTPVSGGRSALRIVEAFARGLGARPFVIGAKEHDRLVARTSHLAHFVSAALAASNGAALRSNAGRALAGNGLRSVTRLADGDPKLWSDIARGNRKELRAALREFMEQLASVGEPASPRLRAMLERARATRKLLKAGR